MRLVTCLVAASIVLLTVTGCANTLPGTPGAAEPGSPTPGVPAASAPPARAAFAPYVDTSAGVPDLAALAARTGLKHVVLAFVLARGHGCDPAWSGTDPLDSLEDSIAAFRAVGGSVTIATGGADGTYLENTCKSSADLAAAYTKILDATGAKLLDIDIEHDVRIATVVDALSQVQRARGTDITLTLPVDLDGLGPGQLDLVRHAAAANLAFTTNVMDMDFDADGDWGQGMVDAAKTMLRQLHTVYPKAGDAEQSRRLGITIMIGRNDNGTITRPGDVQTVLDFAKTHGVGRLGIWSLTRDVGTCPRRVEAQPDCSGIAQKDYQFTQQLAAFAGPVPA